MKSIEDMQNYLEEWEYELFLANLSTSRVSTPQFLSSRDRPASIIGAAFIWGNTPEGHNFWADIHARLARQEELKNGYAIKSN